MSMTSPSLVSLIPRGNILYNIFLLQAERISIELKEWQEKCAEAERKLIQIEEHNCQLIEQISELKNNITEKQTNHSFKEQELLSTIASCNQRISSLESEISSKPKQEDNSNKKVVIFLNLTK